MAFLQWRRGIATMEENFIRLSITPYQKNLQVWRQLWRALERSDLAVQIIDARNPIFFYCPDIKIYLNEMIDGGQLKGMLVVLNKADLLSQEMRNQWNEYFCKQGIQHVFFSAKMELDQIQGFKNTADQIVEMAENSLNDGGNLEDLRVEGGILNNKFGNLDIESDQDQDEQQDEAQKQQDEGREKVDGKSQQEDSQNVKQIKQQGHKEKTLLKQQEPMPQDATKSFNNQQSFLNSSKLLNRRQLHLLIRKMSVKYWKKKQQSLKKGIDDIKQQDQSETQTMNQSTLSNKLKLQPVVGMIGYPNVGKSSLINALLGKKQVAVAAMPGKTRYLQTIFINPPQNTEASQNYNRICLCDCPGLVFPSFTNSRAELVCAGVIPIDHLREFLTSIDLVTKRVKKEQLEECYKISLLQNFSGQTFLKKVAAQRGFVTGSSLPDTGKVARLVLKDFVSGKLCFCHRAPNNLRAQECENKDQTDDDDEIKQGDQKDASVQCNSQQQKKETQQPQIKTLKQQKQSELDSEFFVVEQRQMKQKNKLTKNQKRAIKFAILRGEKDIQSSVAKAVSKNSKKFSKGHKLKIGKQYYGPNEVIQRGKGGMDLTDF